MFRLPTLQQKVYSFKGLLIILNCWENSEWNLTSRRAETVPYTTPAAKCWSSRHCVQTVWSYAALSLQVTSFLDATFRNGLAKVDLSGGHHSHLNSHPLVLISVARSRTVFTSAIILKRTGRQTRWCGVECWQRYTTQSMGQDCIHMGHVTHHRWKPHGTHVNKNLNVSQTAVVEQFYFQYVTWIKSNRPLKF